MDWISDPQMIAALFTLTLLEIVLGIDNIIFISIIVGRLPPEMRQKARIFGLALAMATRIGLLFTLTWVMGLTATLFTVVGYDISGRDLILISGGLFLLAKSTHEINASLEGPEENLKSYSAYGYLGTLVQIAIIDIVFSLDSVITAVGLVQELSVMVLAIVLSVLVMMAASKAISDFVDTHPTVKMLALSFLILVGVALVAEGFDYHIPRGFIYFAMAFSLAVELLNIHARKRTNNPIKLRKSLQKDQENGQ